MIPARCAGGAVTFLALLMSGCLHSASTASQEAEPARAVIRGVPFVGYREGAGLAKKYEVLNDPALNPSYPASFAMVLKYWGHDFSLVRSMGEEAFFKGQGGWVVPHGRAQTPREVRELIARGNPVVVLTTLTPVAHTSNLMFAVARSKGLRLKPPALQSRVLGVMEPLESFREVQKNLNMDPWESLFETARVLVGYDDTERKVLLHDPSFGPNWPVPYEDFEKMWGARGRVYVAAYPADPGARPGTLTDSSLARTDDQKAAEHYVFGYALAAVGRPREAQARFKAGLAIPNVAPAYRHLLAFELAVSHWARGNAAEALASVEEAIALLPEHPRPWLLLAAIHGRPGGDGKKAEEAEAKATALCTDADALQRMNQALPRDLTLFAACPDSPGKSAR